MHDGRAVWWEPDADDRLVVVPLTCSTLLYPQPPVRVGPVRWLLRTDDGFRVVRMRPAP